MRRLLAALLSDAAEQGAELMLLTGDMVNLGRRDRAEGPHAAALHTLAANAAA